MTRPLSIGFDPGAPGGGMSVAQIGPHAVSGQAPIQMQAP